MARKSNGREPRPNSRMFRYSDTVKNVLSMYSTEGNLNDALDDLVLDAHSSEKERKERIKELDKLIASREAELKKLNSKIDITNNIIRKLDYIKGYAESMERELKSLSTDASRLESLDVS